MWNTLKTTALLGGLTGMLLFMGGLFGGREGMALMLVVSLLMNLGTWFFSDSIVLRTTGAVPVDPRQLGWLQDDVQELARNAGIPTPRLYVLPHEHSPNAFATGRSPSKGVVAVTAGLLNTLDRREIRGVLAHEIGHIANRDTLVSAVAASIAGVITWLAYSSRFFLGGRDEDRPNPLVLLLMSLLAPLAAVVVRMAISRTREYGADAHAARISGDPEGLAMALEGLSRGVRRAPMHSDAQAVHFIVNGFSGGLSGLFSTHPPIEERARRLRAMSRR
jgi:heat shock protein HtpX